MEDLSNKSSDELSQALDQKLLEYENFIGLPSVNKNTETIEKLLNINGDLMRKMSAEECGISALQLSQFSFHIQKCYNMENAKLNWATSMIMRTIAPSLNSYKVYSFEEKKALAIKENEHAKKLEIIKIRAQGRVDRLSYISSRVESVKDAFLALQQTKRNLK